MDDLNLFHRFMTSGPSTFAVVSKGHTGRSTSDALRDLIGPTDPDTAKQENPRCLTALYGTDELLNGFYSSSSNEEALTSVLPDGREVTHVVLAHLGKYN
jgi:nucleoside diphosphate kinase homolog 5